MTGEIMEFVEHCVKQYEMAGAVLEVGSFDVCGNPRHLFSDLKRFPEYTGVDQNVGPNVDEVMNSHDLLFENATFGVVVSCDMIEHDTAFWISVQEMARVLASEGHMILTTRSWKGCAPHGEGYGDYWRFLDDGLRQLMDTNGLVPLEVIDCETDYGIFAVGRKP